MTDKKHKKKKKLAKTKSDNNLYVPSNKELEDLIERIRNENDKIISQEESIKARHLREVELIINKIFKEFEDQKPMLLMKILLLECINELINYHKEKSVKYFKSKDIDYAKVWYKDQILLKECEKDIKAISLGSDDWT